MACSNQFNIPKYFISFVNYSTFAVSHVCQSEYQLVTWNAVEINEHTELKYVN